MNYSSKLSFILHPSCFILLELLSEGQCIVKYESSRHLCDDSRLDSQHPELRTYFSRQPCAPHNSAREQISRKKDLLRANSTGTSSLCIVAVPGSIALLAIVDCKDFLRQVCEALLVVLHGLLITQLKSTRRKPCDALLVVLHGLPIILQRLVLYILLYYNAWTEQAGSSRRS